MFVRSLVMVLSVLLCVGGTLAQPATNAPATSPLFKQLDKNSDGKITKDELDRPIFRAIDANQDGAITPEEDRAFAGRRGNEQPMGRGQRPAARPPETVRVELDLPYAGTNNPRQKLDLYLPKNPVSERPLPVVAFIHGGGWQNGDKNGGWRTLAPLVESGEYAGVSIGYRLTDEAHWPAQIHDCKAAIRWIRSNAKKYNLNPERIGVTGTSAGGHLVAMLGTSGDVAELEGELGESTGQSSRVTCVVDQFGPTLLKAMGGRHNEPTSPESKLVGGPINEKADVARAASPVTYVSKDDPPFLMLHGTDDPVVPFEQSTLLADALRKVGVGAIIVPVTGAGHGNFGTPEPAARLKQFFDKHLRDQDVSVSTEPITGGAAPPPPSRKAN